MDGVLIARPIKDERGVRVPRAGLEHVAWYVNLEAPWRRSAVGFDSEDRDPDLETHEWKDEDEVAYLVAHGLMTASDAAAARAEGERVLTNARRREPPFGEDWPSWRADPAWPIPELPSDWARI